MIENALRRIGLTEGEIKIYLALLELGSSATGKITKVSGISGSKVYEVLDRLIKKGLVAQMIKNNVKYFEAASPERILDYLEQKTAEIEAENKEIKKIIPELLFKQKQAMHSEVKVFTGFEGAKTVWEEAIKDCKKRDEILGWGLSEQPQSWESYFNERESARDKKGIIHKSIINIRYKSLYESRRSLQNQQFRFFPEDFNMPTTVELWKDKVALFVITKENPITILIQSKAVADSFRKSFYALWESAHQ